MAEWVLVLFGTGVTTVVGLIRYRLRLSFLRHVYDHGGHKALGVAAKATGSRPMLSRRCECQHGREQPHPNGEG